MELSCHGSTEKEAYSPGSPGCTAEGLSEPSLNRMSRSLPSGIEGGRACQVEKTERVCDRESEGAGKVRAAWHTILWVEWPDVKPERQVVGQF